MVLCAPAARLMLSGMLKSHHQKGNSAPWRSQHSCRTRSRRGWPQGVRWRWRQLPPNRILSSASAVAAVAAAVTAAVTAAAAAAAVTAAPPPAQPAAAAVAVAVAATALAAVNSQAHW